MTEKIQEITEKIYNEGIVKAKTDAEQIITEAKKKAGEILKSAETKKAQIIEVANIEAAEIRKNTESEMKLAARQFLSNLKQQITQTVSTVQFKEPVKEAFNDSNFVKNLMETIIKNWNPGSAEQIDLKILIPEKDKNSFSDFLKSETIKTLNKGIDVVVDEKTKTGFKIGPKNDSFVISFSDQDFESYFKTYFKEKTRKLLFEHENDVG